MKTLYFDCAMGAAGDMIMAALLELHLEPDRFLQKINRIGIPGAQISREYIIRHGTKGSHMRILWNGQEEGSYDSHTGPAAVDTPPERNDRSPLNILELIDSLRLSAKVSHDTKAILLLLFEAESHVHGDIPLHDIHQSRLGTMDAVIDIAGSCILMEELAPHWVIVSPIHVGSGHIYCRAGILPVPAPATKYLMQGIPHYSGTIPGEFCTPTAAAMLHYFANSYEVIPDPGTAKSGCGIGGKDFGLPGGLKVWIADT